MTFLEALAMTLKEDNQKGVGPPRGKDFVRVALFYCAHHEYCNPRDDVDESVKWIGH